MCLNTLMLRFYRRRISLLSIKSIIECFIDYNVTVAENINELLAIVPNSANFTVINNTILIAYEDVKNERTVEELINLQGINQYHIIYLTREQHQTYSSLESRLSTFF